jgi:hypothetical protein
MDFEFVIFRPMADGRWPMADGGRANVFFRNTQALRFRPVTTAGSGAVDALPGGRAPSGRRRKKTPVLAGGRRNTWKRDTLPIRFVSAG